MITISFETQNLHDNCVNLQRAEQRFGRITAEALVTFLSDTAALENVEELINLLDKDVQIALDDSLLVAIGSKWQATLIVVGNRFRRDDNGRIVWSSVTRLKLKEIARLP